MRGVWPWILIVFLSGVLTDASCLPLGWVLQTFPLGFLCQLKLRYLKIERHYHFKILISSQNVHHMLSIQSKFSHCLHLPIKIISLLSHSSQKMTFHFSQQAVQKRHAYKAYSLFLYSKQQATA